MMEILDSNDNPYIVSVTVTDKFGCEYEDQVMVSCNGCDTNDDGDGDVAECGDPELVDLEISIKETNQTCHCEFDQKGNVTGVLSECEFTISTNAPTGSTAIMDIAYSENSPTVVTTTVNNTFNINRSCGFGSLSSDACGATFCITLYDEDGRVIGGACDVVACDLEPCIDECYSRDKGDGGERNNEIQAVRSLKATVYPNPIQLSVSNIIQFGGLEFNTATTIQMLDLSGKLIKQERISKGWNKAINLEDMKPGIYFLRISNGGDVLQVEKIVVME